MSFQPSLLQSVPLFADLDAAELQTFISACEQETLEAGQVLFEAGDAPTHLRIVMAGSVSIRDDADEVMTVRAVEPIGELSALTGEARIYSAYVAEPSQMLSITIEALREFLEVHGGISFKLHRNMLRLAARKIGRDRRRQREMRENIVSTQKAMKRMQGALLDSEDNPLHSALFEQLDALIEQNRKVHYLVEPSQLVPTEVSLKSGSKHRVTAISNEWLYFLGHPDSLKVGDELDAVLHLDGADVPVSGKVENLQGGQACVYLDELVEQYDQALSHHLDRARILDVVL